jgi:DNA polymerase-3 subunit epsilon
MARKIQFSLTPDQGRAVVLDTETTGFTPKSGHRIAELAMIEVIDGRETGNVFHSYFNPRRRMPYEAQAVHGLSDAFLKNKPTFASLAGEILEFIGDPDTPLWAHNAPSTSGS